MGEAELKGDIRWVDPYLYSFRGTGRKRHQFYKRIVAICESDVIHPGLLVDGHSGGEIYRLWASQCHLQYRTELRFTLVSDVSLHDLPHSADIRNHEG